ncbi:MAG TPA: cytochrome c oxidase accessory protein CcoG [Hyphomonadaceae bacterium]|nr:cytochrome c oxidase accessory protein CcoG [Hyphomonadaceae bacterium]
MATATLIDLRARRGAKGGGGDAPPPEGDDPMLLYERRKQIYPKLVFGKFRSLKWFLLCFTLGVYYLLPWIRWDRGPGAPDQAVLADFAGGRFYFFGLEIWPQEVYYITGLLILAAVGLFLVTALFGRVWCGYFCPQTVWTDLFLVVERFFEGDRNARMKLDESTMSFNKAWRKTAKHAVWLLVSFATGGAFILYWHDAPTLAKTFFSGQAPATAYVFAGLLTATTYALAGTMREQVCTYMCPWPRIQAAMVDKETLTITYRSERGDPRGPHKKGDSWEDRGDCIDCKQCVVVCPMGIDIRKGAQLECIQCGLCIDACDGIMKKVGRPTGLIAYDTDENVLLRWMKQTPRKFRPLRARTAVYAAVFTLTGAIMLAGLTTRTDLEISALKDRALPYVQLSTGEIRNAYTIKIVNKLHTVRKLQASVEGLSDASVQVIGEVATGATVNVDLGPDEVERYRMLVTAPAAAVVNGGSRINIVLKDEHGAARATASVQFAGPEH